jgi:tripartite-type tricarboxylate transporter receptor subunit TctC
MTAPQNIEHALQRRQIIAAGAVAAGSLALPPTMRSAVAQNAAWPNKPIKIIVAFAPGGLTDSYARLYAEQLTAKFGVQAIVENKPGAGAIIAIDAVAKSPPDGYTLLMTTSGTVWQNRVLYNKLPYNLDKDIVPVAFFPSGPLVVGVPEKIGVNTMRELIEYAAATRRARIRRWWLIKPIATRARRSSRSTIAANHRCGSMWRAGSCRWPLAATSRLPRCNRVA